MKLLTPGPRREETVRPLKSGMDLLQDPTLNKGSAFPLEERVRFGLVGLLPPYVSTIEEQVPRVLENIRGQCTDLAKYLEMMALLDRNETLFYRVVVDHIEEMMPIIYTPTVGRACQAYGHIFRRPRGLFVTRQDRGGVRELLGRWPRRDARVIVVTDGERVLGLGDLGSSGMGIPVGKLALYTACGGLRPSQGLPVTLDVGTDNEQLLADPLYLGVRERRLQGAAYDELVAEFVESVQREFPGALIQFEDFASRNAFRLLGRYRDRVCAFNDDIQGTAAVALAGLYSAGRVTGRRLADQKVLFFGAGEAATGIADMAVGAMTAQGLSRAQALARCWLIDSRGLVESGRRDLQEHKRPYAHPHRPIHGLVEAVEDLRPSALIGVSGQSGRFDRAVLEAMARVNPRPVVFALSNPTANSECTAQEAYRWTGGRAVFASGSPFGPVAMDGTVFHPGQGNNAYIFPGVGLGVVVSGARRVVDEMFFAAAEALAARVTDRDLAAGSLYPPLRDIRETSADIAAAVAKVAFARGLAEGSAPEDLPAFVRQAQYQPVYRKYI